VRAKQTSVRAYRIPILCRADLGKINPTEVGIKMAMGRNIDFSLFTIFRFYKKKKKMVPK